MSKAITCFDCIQGGKYVLVGFDEGSVKLYETESAKCLKSFDSHTKWISAVEFNPKVESLFLSSSFDGTVKVWDTRQPEAPLYTLKSKAIDMVYDVKWMGKSKLVFGG